MDRYAALIVLGLALTSPAGAKTKKSKSAKQEKLDKKAKSERSLKVRSIDLARRLVMIEVGGFRKPPAPNLFRMTDSRQRHFIAMTVSCEPPFPSGIRVCELELPAGYQRHRLVSVELHTGGLKSQTIAATPGEVESAWTAAQLVTHDPKPKSPPDGGTRDGG